MSSSKQNQPHERQQHGGDRQNGGVASGARAQAQSAAERIQEGAAGVGAQIHEGYDAAREELSNRYRQAEGLVASNPGQSVLVGFGLGLGVGVLLALLFTKEEERSWYDRHLPDSLRDIPDRFRSGAEALARHIPGR